DHTEHQDHSHRLPEEGQAQEEEEQEAQEERREEVGVEAVVTPRNANRPGAERRSGSEVHPRERVSEVQRARMLMAARQVVAEAGYAHMSVERVVARAGVSRKTFYDLFENRED